METPKLLYFALIAFYLVFLGLFLRYFLWGYYAKKRYWNQRPSLSPQMIENLAAAKKKELPFLSLLVPARNEAEVIANTIEHLAGLIYPKNAYEVIIITDEKELLAWRAGKQKGPTTQEVVENKLKEFKRRKGVPFLKHVIVPYDFDGKLGGACLGKEVPSTKARALNYGLGFLDAHSQVCGFYDAESHPEKEVLLYIAYRWLLTEGRVKLWQGPVFQIRNFYQLGPVTKIAALYQAIAHEWYYPALMRSLPFIGGTNFFVASDFIREIGGLDAQSLTEDLEIGVRAYLEADIWPEYFPYISTEQTPATVKAFFRQRLRWGSGHLQVVEKFRQLKHYPLAKQKYILRRLFWKGQGEWVFYQSAVIVALFISILAFSRQISFDGSLLPFPFQQSIRLTSLIYYGFTFYLYLHYLPYLDTSRAPQVPFLRHLAALELIILPLASFFFPLPYSSALILKIMHREPQAWVKTPRTKETKG